MTSPVTSTARRAAARANTFNTASRRIVGAAVVALLGVVAACTPAPPAEVTPGIYVAGDARIVIGENGQFAALNLARGVVDGGGQVVSFRGTWAPDEAAPKNTTALRLSIDPAATPIPLAVAELQLRVDTEDRVSLAEHGDEGERLSLKLTEPGDIHAEVSVDAEPVVHDFPALPADIVTVWWTDAAGPRDLIPAPDHMVDAVVWLTPAEADALWEGCEPEPASELDTPGGELADLAPAGEWVRCDALDERLSDVWHARAFVHRESAVVAIDAWR